MSCLHRYIQYFCWLSSTCIIWNSAQTAQRDSSAYVDSTHFFYQRPEYPRDCKEIHSECSTSRSSGVYLIKPDGYSEPFEVFCDNEVDSGGWTVIQRQIDGAVSFNRDWEEYKQGFGFLSNEFWIGNEKLSFITNQAAYNLRVDMVLSNGSSFFFEYDDFRITDEWGDYAITPLGEYNGNESSVITFCPPDTVVRNSTCVPVPEIFTDCYHAYQSGHRENGVYTIRPSGWIGDPFEVPCNMSIDGGGWTVIQRRVNGSVSFERNWEGYKAGFGILDHELWLGNDRIHNLTKRENYELRMDMVNVLGVAYFAKYNLFSIGNEDSKYQLELGTYDSGSTTTFDAMNYHRDQRFSTPDRDYDRNSGNCASTSRSAWWYNSCQHCDFNRALFQTCSSHYTGWRNLPGSSCLIYTDMKIRPLQNHAK